MQALRDGETLPRLSQVMEEKVGAISDEDWKQHMKEYSPGAAPACIVFANV